MSRSYKKMPFCKENESCKTGKRFANKKVRRKDDLPMRKGNHYKKAYEKWDICDYQEIASWQDALKKYRDDKDWHDKMFKAGIVNEKELWRWFFKVYLMK